MESTWDLLLKGFTTNPFILEVNLSEENKKKLDLLIPYSVGIEVETEPLEEVNCGDLTKQFKNNHPEVLDIDFNSNEQRIRIPSGFIGAKCLYKFSEYLFNNFKFNLSSGLHYHVDFSELESFPTEEDIKNNGEWILKELDSWNYGGSYNIRAVAYNSKGNWVNLRSYLKTMEVRIGNMTFDYKTLIARVMHVNEIAYKFKNLLNISESQRKLVLLREQLISLEDENKIQFQLSEQDAVNIIKNRIVKLY